MMHRTIPPVCGRSRPSVPVAFCLLSAVLLGTTHGSEPGDSLRRTLPRDTVAAVEVLDPAALWGPLLSEAMVRRIESLPWWSTWRQGPGWREWQAGLSLVQLRLGVDWRTAVRTLTGGGVLLALGPGNHAALVVESTDPTLLETAHQLALEIARDHAAKAGQPERVRSEEDGGLTWWTFDGRERHAIAGSRLIVASDPTMRNRLLAAAQGARAESLAGTRSMKLARRRLGDPPLLAWVDLEKVRSASGQNGQRPTRWGDSNPLVALLLDLWPDRLARARWAALGLQADPAKEIVSLRLLTAADPAEAASATPGTTLLPDPRIPGQIAVLQLHRDLHRFYAAKDERFPERTSGLIFFENMMGIFFSGRNLTEEVMAAPAPEWNLVVAAQQFPEGEPVPQPELPGFALVLRLKDPEGFGPVLEEAWQKALGLVNFTRGQQAEPGMILDRPRHRGVTITTAHFSTAGLSREEQADIRFNFQPTLARPGEMAILSSSESLARRLMDAFRQPHRVQPQPVPGIRTRLRVESLPLVALLKRNREALVRANMIQEGHTRAEAEVAIDTLLAGARQLQWLELEAAGEGQPLKARLRLKLAPPPAAPAAPES